MTMLHLFFVASASALAITFLACSKLIGAPYGIWGGGGATGCWAPMGTDPNSNTVTTTSDRSLAVLMSSSCWRADVEGMTAMTQRGAPGD